MLNVFFAGTPECAVPALQAIAAAYPIAGILTNPPAASGRSKKELLPPIALAAEALKEEGILNSDTPILMPQKLDAAFRAAVTALQPDIMVCFAFGKIFGPKSLALFPKGALNIHPSLLPRWRGPSPVPAAIAAGDTITGVTVQCMAQEMDAGDIVLQRQLAVYPNDTAERLLTRCASLGAELIVSALKQIESGVAEPQPQPQQGISYCKLLQKEDGYIRWDKPAAYIDRTIRAYSVWPGAYTYWKGAKIRVLEAAVYNGTVPEQQGNIGLVIGTDKTAGLLVQTGNGLLAIKTLQRETKKAMIWKAFLNGAHSLVGDYLQ